MSQTHVLLATTLDNVSGSVDTIGRSAWGATASNNLPLLVGKVISVLLGILGIIFLVLVVYAGFLYLTAQGEEASVKKAKEILKKAIIGMILIISSYAITNVVTNALVTVGST